MKEATGHPKGEGFPDFWFCASWRLQVSPTASLDDEPPPPLKGRGPQPRYGSDGPDATPVFPGSPPLLPGDATFGSIRGLGLSQMGDLHFGHTLGLIARRRTWGSQ